MPLTASFPRNLASGNWTEAMRYWSSSWTARPTCRKASWIRRKKSTNSWRAPVISLSRTPSTGRQRRYRTSCKKYVRLMRWTASRMHPRWVFWKRFAERWLNFYLKEFSKALWSAQIPSRILSVALLSYLIFKVSTSNFQLLFDFDWMDEWTLDGNRGQERSPIIFIR